MIYKYELLSQYNVNIFKTSYYNLTDAIINRDQMTVHVMFSILIILTICEAKIVVLFLNIKHLPLMVNGSNQQHYIYLSCLIIITDLNYKHSSA